jgi:hypothetical protein
MKKKVILTYCHYQGWGDSMISIFDILNMTDYLKTHYTDFHITLLINDIGNLEVEKILNEILDLKFFENFFDEFRIQVVSFSAFNNSGTVFLDNEIYKRIYSGRNEEVNNNTPGIFDFYVLQENYEEVKNLNLPLLDFTFDENDDRVKNFPIFKKEILERVDDFIAQNFENEFYSICYRSISPINYQNLNDVASTIKLKLNPNQEYFLCSNSAECKERIKDSGLKIKLIRDVSQHNKNEILNGLSISENKIFDAIHSVCEMIILSKSKKIYYSGELSWVSLFTWYAKNVGKVELKIINNL